MPKKFAISILSFLLSVTLPLPGWAETTIEKVARTGVLTAGTATDAIPFAYTDEKKELVGYSVDMLALIKEQLEKELGKKIDLRLVDVTVEDRIPKLVSREVDIVCESVSFTWEREKYVDFSASYGITGTQLLVKQNSELGSPESLSGKKIGAIPGTTNEQAIKLVQPKATLVPIKNIGAGFSALEQGKIDAFAWDGLLLKGFRQTVSNPDAFKVVPEKPYTREGIVCMVPENDSSFRNLVDFTLVRFMQGVAIADSGALAIFDRWFGPKGIVSVNQESVLDFFKYAIETHEQIPTTTSKP
jgi:polar amino acid transport system substrate-binding protein